ncbi:MAG: hypothetical protein ACI9WS_000426, partial [Paraglaciecola psychrophila]
MIRGRFSLDSGPSIAQIHGFERSQKCQLRTSTLIMKLTDPAFKGAITKVG